ncbi:MAG: phenylalanine--tRNA ligase subunit beta [Patescibacteria group bacterium]
MYISLNWLKKYVDIPKGFLAADLAAKLTACTVEVEGWKKEGELLDNVVVGKILEIKDHPNADKLKLVVVDIGKKKTEVVCGGTNLKKGMLVALAKIGARVNWHGAGQIEELKPVKIRGVESQGMICLSSEIGLQDIMPDKSDTEILDLSHLKLKVGQPLAEALHLDDTILEIDNKSLTHRPDLWGHYGLARELAAILKVKFKNYDPKEIKGGRGKNLKVEIKDKEKCRRYIGVVVDNVKIAPSPDWLVRQLESVGVRAINNIVDITNYVMLELGEPMHSFDWREIKGGTIIIDTAQKGEKFTTLDGQERILDEQMLLIKDGKRAVALAGVMGGLNSEIKDDTVTILFEAANFEPNNIRKTSIKLGLRTEGSARWEKNLSPVIAELAMRKAVEMTLELSPGAKVASKVIDQNFYTSQISEIELDLNWLNKRLGTAVAKEEVIGILERLQFEVKDKKNSLIVKVPYWRSTKDVSIAEDLVEEIARIYGYDNIKPTMPSAPVAPPKANLERVGNARLKKFLP